MKAQRFSLKKSKNKKKLGEKNTREDKKTSIIP
jgi:hypothetical protein